MEFGSMIRGCFPNGEPRNLHWRSSREGLWFMLPVTWAGWLYSLWKECIIIYLSFSNMFNILMVGTSAWTMHTHYGYYGWMKALLCSQWYSSSRTEWIPGSPGLIHGQKIGNWGGSQSGGSPGYHDLGNILNWTIQIIGYQWVSPWINTKTQPTLFYLCSFWAPVERVVSQYKRLQSPSFPRGTVPTHNGASSGWKIRTHLGRQRVTPWARRRMLDVGGLGPGDRRGRPQFSNDGM